MNQLEYSEANIFRITSLRNLLLLHYHFASKHTIHCSITCTLCVYPGNSINWIWLTYIIKYQNAKIIGFQEIIWLLGLIENGKTIVTKFSVVLHHNFVILSKVTLGLQCTFVGIRVHQLQAALTVKDQGQSQIRQQFNN